MFFSALCSFSVRFLQPISVWCCSESSISTVPPSPWTAEPCTGPAGFTAEQEAGNEMGVSLTAPGNTSVLWPSVLAGIRCSFLFTCLSGGVTKRVPFIPAGNYAWEQIDFHSAVLSRCKSWTQGHGGNVWGMIWACFLMALWVQMFISCCTSWWWP